MDNEKKVPAEETPPPVPAKAGAVLPVATAVRLAQKVDELELEAARLATAAAEVLSASAAPVSSETADMTAVRVPADEPAPAAPVADEPVAAPESPEQAREVADTTLVKVPADEPTHDEGAEARQPTDGLEDWFSTQRPDTEAPRPSRSERLRGWWSVRTAGLRRRAAHLRERVSGLTQRVVDKFRQLDWQRALALALAAIIIGSLFYYTKKEKEPSMSVPGVAMAEFEDTNPLPGERESVDEPVAAPEQVRERGLLSRATSVVQKDAEARAVIGAHEVRLGEVEGVVKKTAEEVESLKKSPQPAPPPLPPSPTVQLAPAVPPLQADESVRVCAKNVARAWERVGRMFTVEEVEAACKAAKADLGF